MKVMVKTQGLDKIEKELASFEKKATQGLDQIVKTAAVLCVALAKKNLSRPYPQGARDTSQLHDNITYERGPQSEGITYRVGTNVEHAPFIEFGTKPHFPPLGDENKGLIRWVMRHMRSARGQKPVFSGVKRKDRKAVAKQIAMAIAWKIYHHGTPPKPFLRPAFIQAKQKLLQDLEAKYK